MIYQLVTDENRIYDDIGNDGGLVQGVDWAKIGGDYCLWIMCGGTQRIDGNDFEVLSIFEHPESSSLWFYAKHHASGQIYQIVPDAGIDFECGLDTRPQPQFKSGNWEELFSIEEDDLPF